MKIKNYKPLKNLLLLGLVVTPAIISSSIILVQKLDKKYLLFDNKIFSSYKSLDNYLNKKKISSFAKMDAKSYYFDNQIFNTSQEFHEYLTNKFDIDEKLTNKIPGNYTINEAGELSRQVLLDDTDQALKIYRGKNGVAYQNRKAALDTFINYHKIYTFEGKEFNTPYEVTEYLKNVKLKALDAEDAQKELVYQNGGLMQSEAEIKSWLRRNLKNGFEYQGKIFSDYNYKEFLTYFKDLDDNLVEKNITKILNPDKSAYWLNIDNNNQEGYFIGPKYVETSSKLPVSINDAFHTIKSFTPNLFLDIASLSVFNKIVDLDYASKMKNENSSWDFTKKDGLELYIQELRKMEIIENNILDQIEKLLFNKNSSSPYLNQIVEDSVANLNQIDNYEFTDFHRLLVIIKRIMVPARIYSGINTVEIENVFKELIIQIITKNQKINNLFDLKTNLENRKLEEIIDLFLNPESFYQTNANQESTLAMIQKIDDITSTIMDGVKKGTDISDKITKLQEKYKSQNKDDNELNKERKILIDTITNNVTTNIDKILKEHLGIENEKNKAILANSPFSIGIGGFAKWLSVAWELSNTLNFISVKTLEYKIDEYQSIYYVVPTFKMPLFGIEADVRQPAIQTVKLNDSALNYMMPKKTDNEEKPAVIFELEGKYYLKEENAKNELRSKIYLNPEKYIPCKIIFTSIFEKDEGYQLPDWLVNAKIQKKPSDINDEETISYAEYLKNLNEEKDKYVDRLFITYFQSSKNYYYLDGFGSYFSTKAEAIASLKLKVENKQIIEESAAYIYEARNGKRIITKSEEEIQNFIFHNELIDEKTIMSADLIESSIYDQLSEYSKLYFSVYELDFYGDKKYFMSTKQLWTYLLNNLDYEINYYKLNLEDYNYKDNHFKSQDELMSWVTFNTKTINAFQIDGKEIITYE